MTLKIGFDMTSSSVSHRYLAQYEPQSILPPWGEGDGLKAMPSNFTPTPTLLRQG